MSGCPYRNFDECPQHNKKGGCEFWMSYSSTSGVTEAAMEGCAVVLTPMLLLEQANALGKVAGQVNGVAAEVSAARAEATRGAEAPRRQLVGLAIGHIELIEPDYPSIGGSHA